MGGTLVGRVGELRWLRRRLHDRDPGIVLVSGPAGIGKSTLLAHATAELDRSVFRGQGLPGLTWKPYLPLAVACGQDLDGRATVVADRVAGTVGDALLVLDDVHWCDADTLDAIEELSERIPMCCAGRAGWAAVHRIRSLTGASRRLELAALADVDAHALVAQRRPGLPALERERVVASAAGSPLLLELASPASTGSEAADVLRAEVARLDDDERRVLARLALGAELDPEATTTTGKLVGRGLVLAGDGGLRVRHDLVEEAVLAELDHDALVELQLELAERSDDPGVRARCLAAAGRSEVAAHEALRAARATESVYERADHLVLAAGLIDDHALRVEAAAAALEATRDQDALALLADRDVTELELDALLVVAHASWTLGRYELAVRACDEGIRAAMGADPSAEARLLALRARLTARVEWDGAGALALARRAIALCERQGLHLPETHGALATASLVAGTDDWRAALDRAIDESTQVEDGRTLATAVDTLFFAELIQGEPSRCEEIAQRGLAITTDLGWPVFSAQMRKNLLLARFHVGGQLGPVVDEARALRRRSIHARTRDHLDVHLALALADLGDMAGALDVVDGSVSWESDDPTTRAMIHWAAAEVRWSAGRWEHAVDAAAVCRTIPALGFPAADLVEPIRQWAMLDMGLGVGDALPEPGFANVLGAHLESRAIVALAAGRPAEAGELFQQAAAAWARVSVRGSLRCRWGAGLAAVEGSDEAGARGLLEPLAIELEEARRRPLMHRCRATLRRIGVRTNSTGVPVGTFTGAQAECLHLVARGLGSEEIARRLHVSRSTVDSTIKSAMAKCGATSRISAALQLVELESPTGGSEDQELVVTSDLGVAERCGAVLDGEPLALDSLDRSAFDLGAPRRAVVAEVLDDVDADRCVLAAARGAHVIVVVGRDDPRRSALLDGLRRIGPVREVEDDIPAVDGRLRHAVALLHDGHTVAATAREVGWSRRSLHRELERARTLLGVDTNAQLIVALANRPDGPLHDLNDAPHR